MQMKKCFGWNGERDPEGYRIEERPAERWEKGEASPIENGSYQEAHTWCLKAVASRLLSQLRQPKPALPPT